MIIGITGGSGSGKSTVVKYLADEGFFVIDADKVARDIVKAGEPANEQIKNHFGKEVFFDDGSLNRKKLGQIVFSDKNELEVLNSITHKYILDRIKNQIEQNKDKDIIIDAALLKKGGLDRLCDVSILITADKDIRIKRLVKRDSIDENAAKMRISSQQTDGEYKKECDFSFDNSKEGAAAKIKDEILKTVIKKA